jgi:ADP-ribosylglycohydrolase
MNRHAALERAKGSLDGLSVGDAFGELFFRRALPHASQGDLPPGPWRWTDDTHEALSIVEVLAAKGRIDQDRLAQALAQRFARDPYRGYGGGARQLLGQMATGADWREVAPRLFVSGSYGNGASMRVAPVGGYFAGDPQRAAEEAQRAAVVTHAHPEGQAGAMAVAAAAAVAAVPAVAGGAGQPSLAGRAFLDAVLPYVPEGLTRQGIVHAGDIPSGALDEAVARLGAGSQVSAQDTVPFCLWSAAYHLHDFEGAMWWTVRGGGDRDTTCAIVGGIVALSAGRVPASWLARREPLEPLTV